MSGPHSGERVRIAPDWLPNTNHAGFYVALRRGYYAEQGLDVEILPFDGEAMPNRKIVSGETEFGLMPEQSLLSMHRAGHDVVSVAALIQRNTTSLMVLEESGITRAADMAGKRYASYGTDYEVAMIEDAIRRDGGTGRLTLVPAEKLDILDALFRGEIDIGWGFYAWEGVQADLAGYAVRHFLMPDIGIPNEYFPLLFTTRARVEKEPELVTAMIRATRRGYEEAARDPEAATEAILALAPPELLPQPASDLVRQSMGWLAPYLAERAATDGEPKPWGWHEPAIWIAFRRYAARIASEQGAPEPAHESETAGFTNAFVAG